MVSALEEVRSCTKKISAALPPVTARRQACNKIDAPVEGKHIVPTEKQMDGAEKEGSKNEWWCDANAVRGETKRDDDAKKILAALPVTAQRQACDKVDAVTEGKHTVPMEVQLTLQWCQQGRM